MSRLADLIAELCPEGVEYKPLGELLVYQQPTPFLVSSKDYDPSYPTPVLTAGATFLLGYSSETHGVYAASTDDPVIIFDDFTTASKWVDFPFKLKSSAAKILTAADPSVADIRFLYFLMQTIKYQVGSHARHWIAVYSKMPVCCPPLEVQREIVRILDQFTTLEAELEAELEARRAQYEHYRNHLLSYDSLAARGPVEMVKLGDVVEMRRGNGMQKSSFVDKGVPALHYGHIFSRYSVSTSVAAAYVSKGDAKKLVPVMPGDLVLANTSENLDDVGKAVVWKGEEKAVVGGHATAISSDLLDMGFLSHYVRSTHFSLSKRKFAQGTKVIELSAANLGKIPVPLPELSEQRRIADLLDRFEALINDISSGLPAEIAARRAQYEHYRDRLLSFPEKKAE